MNEKRLISRVIPKHGSEAAWSLAKNFIPKLSEIVVYDADKNHNYARFKIGDGTTSVIDLPFADEEIIKKIEGLDTINKEYVDSTIQTLIDRIAAIEEQLANLTKAEEAVF